MKRKRFLLTPLLLMALLVVPRMAQAQSLRDYSFATGIDATKWINLPSTASSFSFTSNDDGQQSVDPVSIGFTFMLGSDSYTHFSVNTNGRMKLSNAGGAKVSTLYTTHFTSTGVEASSTPAQLPLLGAWWSDAEINASRGHYVKYALTGTAPNRVLVVETASSLNRTNATGIRKYQIQLHENGNKVVYTYAALEGSTATTTSNAAQIGIIHTVNDFVKVNATTHAAEYTASSTTFSNIPTAGRYYEFTRVERNCPMVTATMSNLTGTSVTFGLNSSTTTGNFLFEHKDTADDFPAFRGRGTVVSIPANTTTHILSGLSSATTYKVHIAHVCSTGTDDTSYVSTYEFATPCVSTALPWMETFENYTAASTATLSPCEKKGYMNRTTNAVSSRTSYPYPSTTYAYRGTKSLYMAATSTLYSYIALPLFDSMPSALSLSFRMLRSTTSAYYGRVHVGVASDPMDMTTYTELGTYACTQNLVWESFTADLSAAPAGKPYIIIRTNETSTGYAYIDDIYVGRRSSCTAPNNPTIRLLTDESATIAWTAGDTVSTRRYVVEYATSAFVPGRGQHNATIVSGNQVALTNLSPSTTYTFAVRAICADGDTTAPTMTTFTTSAAALPLPYYNNFDSYSGTSGSASLSPFYKGYVTRSSGARVETSYPYPSATTPESGTRSIYFYSSSTNYSYLGLPLLQGNIRDMQVSFGVRKTSAAYGHIKVAVATSPYDPSTFTVVGSVQPSVVSAWETFTVPLSSYTGQGRFIVLLCDSIAANYAYVDDIRVETIVQPATPHATATPILGTRARVAWTAVSGAQKYRIEYTSAGHYFPGSGSNLTVLETTSLYDTLRNLNPTTAHYGYVYAINNNDTSRGAFFKFTTGCAAPDESPYMIENFESYTVSTYGYNNINSCWERWWYGYEDPDWYDPDEPTNPDWMEYRDDTLPYVRTNYAHSGTKSLYLDNDGEDFFGLVALPAAGSNLRNTIMRLRVLKTSGDHGHITVGMASNVDYDEQHPFTPIRSIQPSEVGVWETFDIDFSGYTGTYNVIEIRSTGGGWSTAYIDDIEFFQRPACADPTNIRTSTLQDTCATLSWDDAAGVGNYIVYYDNTFPGMNGTYRNQLVVNGGLSVALRGLTANTTYYYKVVRVCGVGDTSLGFDGSFKTVCSAEAIPYFEGFESWTTGAAYQPTCVKKYYLPNFNTSSYPYALTSQHATGTKSLYMYGATTVMSYITLPLMSESLDTLALTFKIFKTGTTVGYGNVEVGVMSSPRDTATFHRLALRSATNTSTWETKEVLLAGAERYGRYITIRTPREMGTNYTYLDDIQVDYRPACARPNNLTLTSIGDTTVTLQWENPFHYQGFIVEVNDGQMVPGVTRAMATYYTTDTTLVVNGLDERSLYYVYVRSVCGPRDTSDYEMTSFRTQCSAIAEAALPYFDGFEAYTASTTAAINPCWTKYYMPSRATNSYPYTSTGQHATGTKSLYFYASTAIYSYVATPAFETPVQNLMLDFKMFRGSANYSNPMVVGVMTNPNDISTFEEVARFVPNGVSTWTEFHTEFHNYTGTGRYIALRYPNFTTSSYCYVDDITINKYNPCHAPRGISVSAYDTAAIISWEEDPNISRWLVAYDSVPFSSGALASFHSVVTSNPARLSHLAPSSTYGMYIYALCYDSVNRTYDTSDASSLISFRTNCMAIDSLPYLEDFESYVASTSSPIGPCWIKYYNVGTGSTTSYPYPSSTAAAAHSGTRSLYFSGYKSGTVQYGAYAVMPMFVDSIQNLYVDFWAAKTSTTAYYGYLQVGVMTNPYDTSTFTPVKTVYVDTVNKPRHFQVFLQDYRGTGRYIAFRGRNGSTTAGTGYVYLDDVMVDRRPDCMFVSNFRVSNVGGTSATLRWDVVDTSIHDYEVAVALASDSNYAIGNGTPAALEFPSDTDRVDITGLEQQTDYVAYIRTLCTDGSYGPTMRVPFTTPCMISHSSMPFREDFDSYQGGTSGTAVVPTCFNKFYSVGSSRSSYPYLYTTYFQSAPNSMYFYSYNGSKPYLILPIFEDSINRLSLEFDAMRTSTSASYGWLEVGVMSSTSDSSDFTRIRRMQVTSSAQVWTHYTVSLADYTGPKNRIAIRAHYGNNTSGNYVYIDNIKVNYLSACPAVSSFTVDSIGETAVRLAWVDNNASSTTWTIEYADEPFAPGNGDGTIRQVTGSRTCTITGLTPGTKYYFYIAPNCSLADDPNYTELDLQTECERIPTASLPWTENFDDYDASSTAQLSSCIHKYYYASGFNGVTNNFPYPQATYVHSSPRSLYMYGSSATAYSYFTLPMFEAPIRDLVVNLNMLRTSTTTTYGKVEVGVMVNPADTSSFRKVADLTVTAPVYEWQNFNVPLASYTGNGRFITVRARTTGTDYVYVDDVTVDLNHDCAAPASVVATATRFDTVTVTINDPLHRGNYLVRYGEFPTVYGQGLSAVVTDTVFRFASRPGTTYEIDVSAICTGGTGLTTRTTVTTPCHSYRREDLPIVEGFENYGAVSSLPLNPCWTKAYVTRSNLSKNRISYPYPSSTTPHEGAHCAYFYCTTTYYAYLTMPKVDVPLDSLQLIFWSRSSATSYRGCYVGLTTNPDDRASFIPLSSLWDGSTTWHRYQFDFLDLPDSIRNSSNYHVMFVLDTAASSYLYIDDITLRMKPNCSRVENMAAAAYPDSAVLVWTETSEATQWEVLVDTVPTFEHPRTFIVGDTFCSINGLESQRTYYTRVRAICGEGDTSELNAYNFTTPCAADSIPWREDFNSFIAATATPLASCWTKNYTNGVTGNPLSYPYPITTYNHSGTGNSLYFYCASGYKTYLSLNAFDVPLDTLVLRFWAHPGGTGYYGHMRVGVTSSPDDMNSFYEVKKFHAPVSQWTEYEVTFRGIPSTHRFITFLCDTIGSNAVYLDDITLDYLPSCPYVGNLRVENVTTSSAVVKWSELGSATSWQVEVANNATFANATRQTLMVDTLAITGLTHSSRYYVRVRPSCSTSSVDWRMTQFYTSCAPLTTFPYVIDFEGFTAATGAPMHPCWSKAYRSSASGTWYYTSYPYISTSTPHGGTNNVCFYGSSGYTVYLSLNEMGVPLDSLMMTYWVRRSSTSYTGFQVGVTSDPTDMTTFIPLATPLPSSTSYTEYELQFTSAPRTHKYITFRLQPTTSSYFYLDDIRIEYVPTCPRVETISTPVINSNDATVAWVEEGTATQWEVLFDTLLDMSTASRFIVDTTPRFTFTGLQPQRAYYVNVRPICAVGDTGFALRHIHTFTTACAALTFADLPYEDNFDRYTASSTAALSPCYYKVYYNGSTLSQTSYPYPSTSYSHSRNNSLYWYSGSTTSSWLMLPPYADTVQDLMVDFYALRTSTSTTYGMIEVGVMENPRDTSTYTAVQRVVVSEPAYSWQHFEVSLAGYTGSGRYVTLRRPKGTAGYTYLDDLRLSAIPSCPAAYDVAVVPNIHYADVAWTAGTVAANRPQGYLLTLINNETNATQLFTVGDTNAFRLVDLDAVTSYSVAVQPLCGAGDFGLADTAHFLTRCATLMTEVSASSLNLPATTTYMLPVNNSTRYSYTQQVFGPAEMGAARDINGIAFQYNYSLAMSAKTDVSIYLGYAPRASLVEWVPFDSLTLVYRGPLNCVQGWNEFTFDRPFHYDGTHNVVLAIDDNSYTYNSSTYTFNGHTIANKALYYSNASTNPDPSNLTGIVPTELGYRNNVRWLTCSDTICLEPFVRVDSTDATQAYITIAAGNAEDSWKVRYRQHGATVWTYGTDATATRHTIRTLSPGVQYDAEVGAVCRDTVWTSFSFTTTCVPIALTASNVGITTADLSWNDLCSGTTKWEVRYGAAGFGLDDSAATSVYHTQAATTTPTMTLSGLEAGQAYEAYVRAVDPTANTALTAWSTAAGFATHVCDSVTDLAARIDTATVEGTTVIVSWTAGPNHDATTSYLIEYGPRGFLEGEGDTLRVTGSTTATLRFPNEEETYVFFVRSFCEGRYGSTWTTNLVMVDVQEVGDDPDPNAIDGAEGVQVRLYPNPASGSTTVSLEGVSGTVELTVVDMNGRSVRTERVECDGDCAHRMELSGLSAGVYFVRISSEGTDVVRKLVVR
ncbi:MAG: fibronectin type III domain-containing protein [Bacteroidales bacterium]|nr:fibronectin type III domain-containing protein [Bacteroidales bacterium]